MRYYISDYHFWHSGINFRMDKRGFKNAEEMNEYMLKKLNSRVRKNDELIILGDFSIGNSEQTKEILDRINCKKIGLIVGNHDSYLRDKLFDTSRFWFVKDYAELNDNGRKIICSHYPIMCYNGQFRRDDKGNPKTYMLYGHVHSTPDLVGIEKYKDFVRSFPRISRGSDVPTPAPINMINCFCMYSNYVPLTLDEWIELDKTGIAMKSVQEDWKYDG